MPTVFLEKGKVVTTIALWAESRQVLFNSIKNREDIPGWVAASLKTRCGRIYDFPKSSDLPYETLPCGCGDLGCIVIQYGSLKTLSGS